MMEKQDKVGFTNEDSGESTGEPASQVVEVNAEEIPQGQSQPDLKKNSLVQGVNEEANQEQFSPIKPHPNLDITAIMEIGNSQSWLCRQEHRLGKHRSSWRQMSLPLLGLV